MPYTPPAQQSPAASRSESPAISRSSSYIKSLTQASQPSGYAAGPRPGLPRSHSSVTYLHRHRRSPSIAKPTAELPAEPCSTPVNNDPELRKPTKPGVNSSLRQSPPPVNDARIPTGAVISPPDSGQNSSDDEENIKFGRSRELENMAELQAAISVITQHRDGSPNGEEEHKRDLKATLGLIVPTLETPQTDDISMNPGQPLSKEARKISHSRSATVDLPRTKVESPDRSSDSDLEDDFKVDRPPMLRKKSGELVRPALRPSTPKRKSTSMPGTPTYSKAVHFDPKLEHVRHFLKVDKPLAVSAGSSPVDNYDGETEFPFGTESTWSREPPFEWEICLGNFPQDTPERQQHPVRVEKVHLSADKKVLIGTIAVHNLAFHKTVISRFTLDYWKTTSEIVAEYNSDVRQLETQDGHDRFNFYIRLEDQANLENKTLFFCIRFNVNGQEFWDSNGGINFQVQFIKKALPQKGKQGMQGNASRPLNSLPRCRPSPSTTRQRPHSTSFDDFANVENEFDSFALSTATLLGDQPLRLRNKTSEKLVPDSPGLRAKAPAQAFGNRYDFGASLSAAIQAAGSALGERSGVQSKSELATHSPASAAEPNGSMQNRKPVENLAGGEIPKPSALTSEKPSLQSQSYNELLDKYCFVRSKVERD